MKQKTGINLVLKAIVALACIAIGAQMSWEPTFMGMAVPISLQTLVILCMAIYFPPLWAGGIVLIYLLLGILGLPVFAGGSKGWEHFTGNSLGYFLGFFAMAVLVSSLSHRREDNTFWSYFSLHLLGTLGILGCGIAYLAMHIGLEKAFLQGFLPFIAGGVLKAIIGAGVNLSMGRKRLFNHKTD